MTVDLTQTVYEAPEDAGSVEVCAILSGPDIERTLSVQLLTSKNTAQGKYLEPSLNLDHIPSPQKKTADDFVGGDSRLQFFPNASTACAPIGILNDTLVESDELFTVTLLLEANQTFSELGNSSAAVVIIDNDGRKSCA